MDRGDVAIRVRFACYVLNDHARDTIVASRDHLLLLARLSAARIEHDADELELSTSALVHIFQRLCNDLDHVLREMRIRSLKTFKPG